MPRRPLAKRDLNHLEGLRVGLYCRVSKLSRKQKAERADWGDQAKSVGDQEAVGLAWIAKRGCTLAAQYRDADRSASRFARKEREEYNRLLGDIKADKLDILWVWELSRAARRLTVLAQLIEDCQEHGVLLAIKDDVHDLSRSSSALVLSILGAISQLESDQISERSQRGLASIAAAGRPHAFPPYGYRRVYDEVTRQLLRQEPDILDGDGRLLEDSPAYVVREIYARIAAGDSLRAISRDLLARGIPAPKGGERWRHSTLRRIALNPTYAGRRVHQGKVLEGVAPMWPALVEDATFAACGRILRDEERMKTLKPGKARHLLSHIACCGKCDAPLEWRMRNTQRPPLAVYQCFDCKGVVIKADPLDQHVEGKIVEWLADPVVFADLAASTDDDAADAARADAQQLRDELADLRQRAKAGTISVAGYAALEPGLLERLAEAEQREQAVRLPQPLVGNIGPQAKAKWATLSLPAKRDVVRTVAEIRVHPLRNGQRRSAIAERITWTPLFGPGAETADSTT